MVANLQLPICAQYAKKNGKLTWLPKKVGRTLMIRLRGARLMTKYKASHDHINNGLGAAEIQYVDRPWCWAYGPTMKSCGPDTAFLGSVRINVVGVRHVVVAPVTSLVKFATWNLGLTHRISMAGLNDILREIGGDDAFEAVKSEVPIKYAKVKKATILFVPTGQWTIPRN